LRAKSFTAIDHAVQMIDCALPRSAICRDWAVRFIRNHRNRSALQTDVIKHPAEPLVVRGIGRIEHRHLNPVETRGLERLEHRHVFLGHMPGPQQQVHSNFHLVLLPLSKNQTAPKMKNRASGITEMVLNDTSAA
jgi:hypothetical protein